jgi:hypothetical protein
MTRPVTAGFPPQREAEKRLRLPRNEYESRKIQWERDPPLTMKELQELDRPTDHRRKIHAELHRSHESIQG